MELPLSLSVELTAFVFCRGLFRGVCFGVGSRVCWLLCFLGVLVFSVGSCNDPNFRQNPSG